MTLQASGQISMADINVELGNSSSATLSIGGTAARTLAGKASGAISLSDFYGKSNGATYTYNNGQPWKLQYSFNTSQTSALGRWTSSTTGLYLATHGSALAATNSRVYIFGGTTNISDSQVAPTAVVQTASINDTGVIGSWSATTALPVALAHSQAVITKNLVYLIGNCTTSAATTTVYCAPINSDGTLGAWTTGSSLAVAVCASGVVITKNRIYLLGGSTTALYTGVISTVQTAAIDSNGVIGTWSTATPLPAARCRGGVVVINNIVYIIGGDGGGSNYLTSIIQATIASDGTLGNWSTSSSSLPNANYRVQAVVVHSKIYVSQSSTTVVLYATVGSDGSIGSWTAGTSLPAYQVGGQAVVTNSRLYLLGGYTSNTLYPRVSYASFAGGLNNYLTSSYSQT